MTFDPIDPPSATALRKFHINFSKSTLSGLSDIHYHTIPLATGTGLLTVLHPRSSNRGNVIIWEGHKNQKLWQDKLLLEQWLEQGLTVSIPLWDVHSIQAPPFHSQWEFNRSTLSPILIFKELLKIKQNFFILVGRGLGTAMCLHTCNHFKNHPSIKGMVLLETPYLEQPISKEEKQWEGNIPHRWHGLPLYSQLFDFFRRLNGETNLSLPLLLVHGSHGKDFAFSKFHKWISKQYGIIFTSLSKQTAYQSLLPLCPTHRESIVKYTQSLFTEET